MKLVMPIILLISLLLTPVAEASFLGGCIHALYRSFQHAAGDKKLVAHLDGLGRIKKAGLATERLVLKRLSKKDDKAMELLIDAGARNIFMTDSRVASTLWRNDMINSSLEPGSTGPDLSFAIYEKESGELVGVLYLEDSGDKNVLTVSYIVRPQSQGQGIATEALKGVLSASRSLSSAVEFVGTTKFDNEASQRVLLSAGFEFERTATPDEVSLPFPIHIYRYSLPPGL